jgi:hypothetical protein
MPIIWNLFKKKTNNAFNHNTCTQVKLVFNFFFIIPVIFIDAFPLLFAIFHNFFVDLPVLTDFAIFFTIFRYFLSIYHF